MPKSNGEPLDPLPNEVYDGEKYSVELKPLNHKHKFTKVSSTEIRCGCGAGYSGSNIDTLLKLLTTD